MHCVLLHVLQSDAFYFLGKVRQAWVHTVYIYIYIYYVYAHLGSVYPYETWDKLQHEAQKLVVFSAQSSAHPIQPTVGTRRAQLSSRSPPVKQPAQMWSNKAEFIHSLPIQLMVSMVILIKVHCDFNLPIQLTVRIWSMVILIKFTVSLSLHCHEFIRFTRVAETILGIQRMNSIGDL